MSDISNQFMEAMRQAGFEPDCTIYPDGKLHRFRDWTEKHSTKDCWYSLFSDYPPSGAFGCWKRGISVWWSAFKTKSHNPRPGRDFAISQLLADDYLKGQQIAEQTWQKAIPSNGAHSYLLAKKIGTHGTRYSQGALLVPVMDVNGLLQGLQRIYPGGQKRFTRFTNKRGHFYMIGEPCDGVICIAEGFATCATIREVSDLTVVVAFDSGNLGPVAESIRHAYLNQTLVLCADNDRDVVGNPGMTKARAAAEAVGGYFVCPQFKNVSSRGTDFNDLFQEEGIDSVRNYFSAWGGSNV